MPRPYWSSVIRATTISRAAADDTGETVRAMPEKSGVPESKKALLYAPTWRDDSYQAGVGYTFDYLIDFDELQRELGDEWVVLFRPHYYIANAFDFSAYEGFVPMNMPGKEAMSHGSQSTARIMGRK